MRQITVTLAGDEIEVVADALAHFSPSLDRHGRHVSLRDRSRRHGIAEALLESIDRTSPTSGPTLAELEARVAALEEYHRA